MVRPRKRSPPPTPEAPVDVQIEPNGTIVLIRPMTARGQDWIAENCMIESWQWFGGALSIEPRCTGDIIAGMRAKGLSVRFGANAEGK